MQFKNFVAAAALAASASALPTAQQDIKIVDTAVGIVESTSCTTPPVELPDTNLKTFGLVASKSGSPLQGQALVGTKGGLSIGDKQDANCYGKKADFASFLLNVETKELFMFNTTEVSKQQLYTDRSGMGRGVLQYTNGDPATIGKRSETKGFAITENDVLRFEGLDFLACPYGDTETTFSVSLDVGVIDPFLSGKNCTSFIAKVFETTEPVGCFYN